MIRKAEESDCINLAALSLQVWLETYAVDGIRSEYSRYATSTFTENYFLERLRAPRYRILVSVEDSFLRGYALINLQSHFHNERHGFEIEKLYVHKSFQGMGIGKKLLEAVKEKIGESFWLYTWVNNDSVSFYKHLGFKEIGQYDFKFEDWLIKNTVLGYG